MYSYWRMIFLRDPDRIKPFCEIFSELWLKYPDLRFGQIISNLSTYAMSKYNKDIFYLEEFEILVILTEMLDK